MKFFCGIWLTLLIAACPVLVADNGHPVSMWPIEGATTNTHLFGSIHMLREPAHTIPSAI